MSGKLLLSRGLEEQETEEERFDTLWPLSVCMYTETHMHAHTQTSIGLQYKHIQYMQVSTDTECACMHTHYGLRS